ncbi:NikR family transcription regulator [Haloferax elongans ATCC BAA-1513]|uniref:NikR family transcription regulator n=1 Tax=Haloferax elongans ATCC BAA-1513 TaxID=1230453 RepID=M0HZ53_HALEO|nr:NikR family transcription regulator [Haloferax elongans]ELZ88993.1 NikR family transcription regulator [Haloferax elongans ATCC BAA-1513]
MTERLRDDLDTFAEEHGYSGRSEVIREACQSLLEEYQETKYESQDVLATVTAVFGYGEPEIERRMMDIRHQFEESIRSNSHNCLKDNAGCVETFVIETEYEDALRFIGTVRGADESVSVEYTLLPVDVMGVEIGKP